MVEFYYFKTNQCLPWALTPMPPLGDISATRIEADKQNKRSKSANLT